MHRSQLYVRHSAGKAGEQITIFWHTISFCRNHNRSVNPPANTCDSILSDIPCDHPTYNEYLEYKASA